MLRALQKQLREERRPRESRADQPPAATSQVAASAPPAAVPALGEPPLAERWQSKLTALYDRHRPLYDSICSLDVAQQTAVLADDDAALLRAPVGSGKTTVLVHKLLYLHFGLGVPLRQIALLTFTNRAAREFRARLDALAGASFSDDDLWLTGTFHRVARTLLCRALPLESLGYRRDFTIMDEAGLEPLLTTLIGRNKLRVGRRQTLPKRLRALGSAATDGGDDSDLAQLATRLAAEKRAQNAMDFDDLIRHATQLVSAATASGDEAAHSWRPRAVLVDEMQDCEPRELALLRALRGPDCRFFAVGDPNQAIYGFRGSAPELFAQAEAEFGCQRYSLPTNYRSTRTIVEAARAVLGLQPAESGALRAARGDGARITIVRHHDPLTEAMYLAERLLALHEGGTPWSQLALLYRLRAQAEPLRQALSARAIPCAEPDLDEEQPDAVCLLTLHAGKGLEFRHVFLCGLNDGLLPMGHGFDVAADAEDRRLLFVGLTRAKDSVEISYLTRPQELGARGEPSPFLRQLPAALTIWQEEQPQPLPAAAPPPAPVLSASDGPQAAAVAEKLPSGGWQLGESVRHSRYGIGIVTAVSDDTIDCSFGKLGPRSFPRALCPLSRVAAS